MDWDTLITEIFDDIKDMNEKNKDRGYDQICNFDTQNMIRENRNITYSDQAGMNARATEAINKIIDIFLIDKEEFCTIRSDDQLEKIEVRIKKMMSVLCHNRDRFDMEFNF